MTNTDAERVSDIVKPVAWVVTASDRVDYIFGDEDAAAKHGVPRPLYTTDIIEAQSKALAEAREYATRLLVSFVTEHCNPVPEWAPLPDLMGVLTQLDNATTITRDMKAALAEATAMDAALTSCAAMLAFLRQREGECLGDHPDWLRRIDGIFTAHAAVIATPVPDRNGSEGGAVRDGDARAGTGGATPPTGPVPFDARETLRLREIERAARELADFIWKSVNVGPLTKAPHREARLWCELREALDTEGESEP